MEIPDTLYKILPLSSWQESLGKGNIQLDSSDDKFIHFSTESQLDRTAQKFFKNKSYAILKVDPNKLEGRLTYEANPGRENKYYHLYGGSIPISSVLEVKLVHSSSQDEPQ